MTRRHLLSLLSALGLAPKPSMAAAAEAPSPDPKAPPTLTLSRAQWKERLTAAQIGRAHV